MGRKEKVTRIIDGDTFETNRRKNPVRLANVDAPEKGQRGAPQARKDLGTLFSRHHAKLLILCTACTLYAECKKNPVA